MPRRYPLSALVTLIVTWVCCLSVPHLFALHGMTGVGAIATELLPGVKRILAYLDHVALCRSIGAEPLSFQQYVGLGKVYRADLRFVFASWTVAAHLWPALGLALVTALIVYVKGAVSRQLAVAMALAFAIIPFFADSRIHDLHQWWGWPQTFMILLTLPLGALAAHAILRRLGMP